MKILFTLLFISSTCISYAQSANVAGNYVYKIDSKDNNTFEYEMNLLDDGTFIFHYYSKIKNGIPPEKNYYGKGKWTVEKNVISFFSDKQKDLDDKFTVDFTNTKARFITKLPRDKTDKIVPTKLQFLKSSIAWMNRIDLLNV